MDSYLKLRLWLVFFGGLTYTVLVPLVTKLHGVYWTTTIISAYMLLTRLSGLVAPYLRFLSLYRNTQLWVLVDSMYFTVSLLYFYNVMTFLYVDAIMMFLVLVLFNVYQVNFNAFCMSNYGEQTFKDYTYTQHKVNSVSGVLSLSSVILLEWLGVDTDTYFYIYWVGLFVCVGLQLTNLRLNGELLREDHNQKVIE